MAAKQGDNSTLRAVFFDLDDTLRVSQPHPNDAFTAFVEEQGVPLSEQDRKESFRWGHSYWANSTTLLDDYEKHQGYEDPFWQNYTRRHLRSLNLDEDTIERLAPDVHSYMGQGYRPQSVLVPDTFAILDQLRAAGLFVGLLTNRTRPIYAEMQELGLDQHLDLFLTGGQMQAFKPDAAFFARPLELLGLSAEQVIYVGDNYYADVQGALNAAIRPILIDHRDLYPEFEGARIAQLGQIFEVLDLEGLPL